MNSKPSTTSLLLHFVSALFVFGNLSAMAQTSYDAATDFAQTQGGTTGSWYYGFSPSDTDNTFNQYPLSDTLGSCSGSFLRWFGFLDPTSGQPTATGDLTPQIARYNGPTSCQNVPPEAVFLHPGPTGRRTILRWKAPAAGTFQVVGTLGKQNSGATTDIKILKNGAGPSLFSGNIGSVSQQPFNFPVTVAAEETLDFSVGWGTNGTYNGDGSILAVKIGVPITESQPAPANQQVWLPGENSVVDVQSGELRGSLAGEATYTTGKVGRAFSFDGSGDYAVVPDNAAQKAPVDAVTLEGWFKFRSVGGIVSLISKPLRNTALNSYTLYLENGQLRGLIGNASQYTRALTDYVPPLNSWTHLAFTFSRSGGSSTLKLYANGIEVTTGVDGTQNIPITYDANPFPLLIGGEYENNGAGFSLNGEADELAVYSRALTQPEIHALVAQGTFGKRLPSPLPGQPLPVNPLSNRRGWWPAEGSPNDFAGLNPPGILRGDAAYALGRVGESFVFDGNGDYVEIPDSPNQRPTTGGVTVEGWFKLNSINNHVAPHLISKPLRNSPYNSYALYLQDNQLKAGHGTPTQWDEIASGFAPNLGVWYHYAYTFDDVNNVQTLYVNGVPIVAPQTTSLPLYCDAIDNALLPYPLLIGAEIENNSPQWGMNGNADEVAIYDRVLPATELLSIYNAALAGKVKAKSTPNGSNVSTPLGNAVVTFAGVSTAGTTVESGIDLGLLPPLPSNVVHTGLAFDISTSAAYQNARQNDVRVSLNTAALPLAKFNRLRILHLENGLWVNRTDRGSVSPMLGTNNLKSLSPFVIVEAEAAFAGLVDQYTAVNSFKSFSFEVTDPETITSITAISSKPEIVPNDPGNLVVTGTGTTRTVTVNPAPNQNGELEITIIVTRGTVSLSDKITLTVFEVNDAPVPTIGLEFPLGGGMLQVSGGTGPFNFTILSGSLPPGLTLSSSGLVSGTAGNGPYNFTIGVRDSNNATANRSFSGTVENPVPVPSSLVSWWAAESTLADMVGNNHGVMRNAPAPGSDHPGGQIYAPGKAGRGLVFDGINDVIVVPHDPSQNITGDLTIEGWIKPTANSAGEPTIISKRSPDNTLCPYVLYLTGGGQLAFASRNGGGWAIYIAAAAVTLNQWSHVAVTIGGGQLRLYVNGQPVVESPYSMIRPEVTGILSIGAAINNSYPESSPAGSFPGSIDELALYSRALAGGEISTLHLSGSGGKAHDEISRDVSPVANPNGRWSYLQQPANALSGTYNKDNATPLTGANPSGPLIAWSAAASVSFNTGNEYFKIDSGGTKIDWLARQFGMGPGPTSEYSVLRWTAPVAGQYAVSGSFAGADTFSTTVDVHIFHNSSELTPVGKRYVGSYRGDGVSHTQVITVAATDTVDFLVGAGGNGFSYDSTVVSASVTLLSVAPFPRIVIEQPVGNPLTAGASSVACGAATLGGSISKTITIRNTGTAPLTGLTVTVDGTNATEFVATPLGVTTLAPGAPPLTFAVNFTPTASGARTAVLRVGSNDTPRSPFEIVLNGSGYSAVGNKIYVWGDNNNGELGDGTLQDRLTPVPAIMTGALASKQVTQVLATNSRSFALTADGKVYSWGANPYGELGDGTEIPRSEPVPVVMSGALAGKTVTALAASSFHTLALTSEGKVYSWGDNFTGQLGLGNTADRNTPQLVEGALAGKIITAISAGGYQSLALASDGTLYGWGNNFYGTVGDKTTVTRLAPVAADFTGTPLEGKTITAIRCGLYRTTVLTSEGKVYAWGFNGNGQVGDGTTTNRLTPVAVNGSLAGKTVTAIAGGLSHYLALTADNQIHAWGFNLYGNLGDGTNTDRWAPVPVNMSGALAGKTITQIMAGGGASMVRTSDGGLFGWGFNLAGQLGNGGTTDSNLPTAVDMSGALAGRTLVAASMEGYHALVIAYAPPAPEIVVENQSGAVLTVVGSPPIDFGAALPGQQRQFALKIRNIGDDLLGGINVSMVGAADFTMTGAGSATLIPGGEQTLTLTFNPTAQGLRAATLHITSNDSDEPAYTIALTGIVGRPISDWREDYFQTTANSGDAADDADSDGDGVENLMEFASGSDPTQSGPIETPISPPAAGMITFTYTRNTLAAAEVLWSVEWVDSLNGGWSANGVSETVTEQNGNLQTVAATMPAGLEGKRFVRLKVTRQ